MSKHLSNSERLRILEEYLNDSSSKYTIQKKYGLLSGNIYTFKEHFTLGRDNFYALLRANGLMLRKRRYRPRTANTASSDMRTCSIQSPYSSPSV